MKEIDFEDWGKLDLRVGEILGAEEVKGADKLFKLKIDLGGESRELVAGLKKHYTKEELDGKKIIVLANLKPKNIKGIESRGMILAAVSDDNGEVKLLKPDGEIETGSRVC